MFYSIYNLGLIRFVCCVVTHKISDTTGLLPVAYEIFVGTANCDQSLAEICRDVLKFTSGELQHGPDRSVH